MAAPICSDAIVRGKDHPLAVGILAGAWLYVIWECWHNGVAYARPATAASSAWPPRTPARAKPHDQEQPLP